MRDGVPMPYTLSSRDPLPTRRPMTTSCHPSTLSATVAAAATGCRRAAGAAKDFDPYNRLTALRVLALAELIPPLPATGETATLTPLVYVPPGGPRRRPTAGAGAPSPGRRATATAASSTSRCWPTSRAATSIPPFDLGTGETASFTNSLDPALLTAACGGLLPGQPTRLNCADGFPIQIMLTVTDGRRDGDDCDDGAAAVLAHGGARPADLWPRHPQRPPRSSTRWSPGCQAATPRSTIRP